MNSRKWAKAVSRNNLRTGDLVLFTRREFPLVVMSVFISAIPDCPMRLPVAASYLQYERTVLEKRYNEARRVLSRS